MGQIIGPPGLIGIASGGLFGFAPNVIPPPVLDGIVDLAFVSATELVGVTAAGNAARSVDGGLTTHNVFAPVATINSFNMVTAGNGAAVAIGTDSGTGANRLVTSTDAGLTWSDTSPAALANAGGLVFSSVAGNAFVAYDSGATQVFLSPDGVTWTQHILAPPQPFPGPFPTAQYAEVAGKLYTGDLNAARVWASPDGIAYTIVVDAVISGANCNGPTFDGASFGALFHNATPSSQFWTSPDGTTWTHASSSATPATVPPYVLANHFSGAFITAINADGQTVASSPDGITWTDHTAGIASFTGGALMLSTPGALFVFALGMIHTADLSTFTLDLDNSNTVNNAKANGAHVVGCGADATGAGVFFRIS